MKRERLWQWVWCLVLCFVLLTLPLLSCAKAPPTAPSPATEPTPVEQNPVVEYASERDLFQPIIDKLQPLGYDGMNQDERRLIDYLCGISQAEVVSSEVLKFAPSSYKEEVTQSLQIKVMDAVLSDSEVSHEEADALTYLSTFPGKTQRDLIEFGLDDISINFLVLNSSPPNQDFARWAVENRLCIQDHKLADLEKQFLQEPSAYTEQLLNHYLSKLSEKYPALVDELRTLPDIKNDEKSVEATEDITYLALIATNPEVKEAFDLMIRGGNPYREIQKAKEVAANIKIDGMRDDWQGIEPVCIDPEKDNEGDIPGTDIRAVYAVTDDNYLYLMWDVVGGPNLAEDLSYCFEVDIDMDGDPEYQPGFRTSGYAWLYDLRESNERKEPPLQLRDTEAAAEEIIEFKIPLNYIGNSPRLEVRPYIWSTSIKLTTDLASASQVGGDYAYEIPKYNTELQILYWLAEQSELNEDDTLAQAIATVNGLFVTMGDDEVRQAVYHDTNDLLNYLRETNEIQKARGYYQLESYPLEAKVCLGWTGNQTPVLSQEHALFLFRDDKLNLNAYEWNNISIETLREMREYMDKMGWVNESVDETVANLEEYFFFSNHWKYTGPKSSESRILIEQMEVSSWFMGNMDFEYKYYLENDVGIGVCTDEEAFVDAWCKSWGVATTALQMMKKGQTHTAVIYCEPTNAKWKVDKKQAEIFSTFDPEINRDYLIFKPPIMQKGYTGDSNIIRDYLPKGWVYLPSSAYVMIRKNIPGEEIEKPLLDGIPSEEMKQWLLYSDLQVQRHLSYKQIRSRLEELYPELALELERLPEIKDGISEQDLEALNDIYSLYAEAENPEVKEAFDLMIEGGTPDPSDFQYEVPNWNTELQVLYWLAKQNEFMKDDTLAQAIAMANGLWVALGDDEVREAVYKDTNDLLNFFRETNELQKARGYYQLEGYPLEAKIALGWTGGDIGRAGILRYRLWSNPTKAYPNPINIHHFIENESRQINLQDYQWNTISIDTLYMMREHMEKMGWLKKGTASMANFIRNYFGRAGSHWIYTSPIWEGSPGDAFITIDGERTVNHNMNNVDLVFQHYVANGKGIGVCDDHTALCNAFLKSYGIPTTVFNYFFGTEAHEMHVEPMFFDPATNTWKLSPPPEKTQRWDAYIFLVPVIQHNYFNYQVFSKHYRTVPDLYHWILSADGYKLGDELSRTGVPSSEMKEWLLYTTP